MLHSTWIVRPSQLATPLSQEILPWLLSLHLLDLTEMERDLGVCQRPLRQKSAGGSLGGGAELRKC